MGLEGQGVGRGMATCGWVAGLLEGIPGILPQGALLLRKLDVKHLRPGQVVNWKCSVKAFTESIHRERFALIYSD